MSDERGSSVIVVSGVAVLLRLVVSVACARMLGGAAYGWLACLVLLVEIAAIIFEFGVADATVRQLPRFVGGRQASLAHWSRRMHGTLALVVVLAVALVAPWWPGVCAGSGTWWATLAYAMGRGIGAIGSAQLAGSQRWGLLAPLWTASALVTAAGTVLGVWWGGVMGFLVGHGIGAAIPAIGLLLISGQCQKGETDAQDQRDFVRASLACWATGSITALVWTRGELLFLRQAVPADKVGSYVAALAMAGLPLLMGGALLSTLIPRLTSGLARGDHAGASALFAAAVRLVALVILPVLALLVSGAPALVGVVYGKAFVSDSFTIQLLTLGAFAVCLAPATALLHALGAFKVLVVAAVAGTAVLILGGLIVVPTHGASGAAAVRNMAQATVLVVHVMALSRRAFTVPWRLLLRLTIAASVPALIMAVARWSFASDLLALVLGGGTGLGAYVAIVRFAGLVSDEDRLRLRAATSGLPRGLRWLAHGAVNAVVR